MNPNCVYRSYNRYERRYDCGEDCVQLGERQCPYAEEDVEKCEAYEANLLPCPLCGNIYPKLKGGKGQFDRVQCLVCWVTGPWYDGHPKDAIAGWNAMPRKIKEAPCTPTSEAEQA